ncbi:MAG: hypothetical protein V7K21_02165 [Nostoc sp.]|uniref:hypothetical protein n=1 Tax=Nostoc sp. TaxID=1180 RepID=UPI002FF733C2
MNEELKHKFYINTDKSKLDVQMIHDFLESSSWAENILLATVEKAINNSLCFGLYEADQQVGFARVFTDSITSTLLKDVFWSLFEDRV